MNISETSSLGNKLKMLATMIHKLKPLYPHFANTVWYEDAVYLLAEFCVPEEFRNTVPKGRPLPDEYYVCRISNLLNVEYVDIYEAFYMTSFDDIYPPTPKEPLPL